MSGRIPSSSRSSRPVRHSLVLALVCTLAAGTVVLAQSGTTYQLHWHVLTSGGELVYGTHYQVHSSFGQPSTVGYSQGTTYLVGQGYWLGDLTPTAVRLVAFAAAPAGPDILVTWETASEHDNMGFHLYRQAGLDGDPVRLNEELIPSRSPGGGQGAAYSFLDSAAPDGVSCLYTLEDVDAGGRRTAHGPVAATAPYALFLSLLQRD